MNHLEELGDNQEDQGFRLEDLEDLPPHSITFTATSF